MGMLSLRFRGVRTPQRPPFVPYGREKLKQEVRGGDIEFNV
jgi:hypothetical protein